MKKLYNSLFVVCLLFLALEAQSQSYTIYYENFDANDGGWVTSTAAGRNGNWNWTNGTTPIVGEGNYWRIQPFSVYSANMLTYLTGPVINTTGFTNVSFAIDIRYDTSNDRDDGARIEYTFDPTGTAGWTPLGSQGAANSVNWYNDAEVLAIGTGANGWSGENVSNDNSESKFLQAIISDASVLDNRLSIRFRVVFGSDGGTADLGVTIDNVIIKGDPIVPFPDPVFAPAAINNNLKLWLKANVGTSTTTDGNGVAVWNDQAFDNHAVGIGATMPIYRNNTTRNINFNPVIDFVKSNRQVLKGKGGYWSQDYFLAVRVNGSFSSATNPGAYFLAGKFSTDAFGVDGTGVSMGRGSARYTNATISHTISSFPNGSTSQPSLTSYGRTFQDDTQTPIDRVLILNIKSNTSVSPPVSEIYLNGKRIDNATGKAGNGQDLLHLDFNNLVYFLGTSYNTLNTTPGIGFNGFLDGRLAEIFTYAAPRTQNEQQKILSYLSLKYGTTLQSSGSTLAFNQGDMDLLDSQDNKIWDISAVSGGFNWDVAGIGRDDASQLNQKQSKSQNNGANPPVLTMGLGDVAATNSANTNSFPTNRSFLVWGSNGQNMNNSGAPIVLAFGPMTVNTVTDISNRKWMVVETGGNVPTVKVQVPTTALTNFTPLMGNDAYVMVVADDENFTSGIETVFLNTNGANQEAFFDFDDTKFITFGVAHETVTPRHLTFDGDDDFVRMDSAPNLGSAFTVMAWIRNTGNNSPANDQVLFAKSNGSTGYNLFYSTNNRVRMEWTDATSNNQVIAVPPPIQIPPNEWHHVAVMYSGGTARLYIDGVEAAVQGGLNAPANTNHTFAIGAQFRSQTDIRNHFNGDIDELRMWTRALTVPQIRFIMNQEIVQDGGNTRGVVIPNTIALNDIAPVNWADMNAYYTMNSYIGTHINDDSQNNQRGRLRVPDFIAINEQNAPLPYVSTTNGAWSSNATWLNGGVMDIPYDVSIVDGSTPVSWNIVQTNHDITSNGNKVLLGLMVDSNILSATNDSKIEVSHYLKIDGKIDLQGRSQLLQTLNSELDPTSSGIAERDQQGTNVIYNYNYWSSPVGISNNTTNNNNYSISAVVRDGNNQATPQNLNFTTALDGSAGPPATLSTRWTFRFDNAGNNINNWISIGSTGAVQAGKGYIHKGTGSGLGYQNYTFQGKPHNGQIQHAISGNMLTLVGNPYASALDSEAFINDNLNAIDGALYFWEHWGGGTHRLLDYQGGYAVLNLSGSTPALSHPDVNQTGGGTVTPGRFVPVGQGFFVIADADGGTLTFNNNQRAFIRENDTDINGNQSNNLVKANKPKEIKVSFDSHFTDNSQDSIVPDNFKRIRLYHFTTQGYKREILLAFTQGQATDSFDNGYDAQNLDGQPEDMYFMLDDKKLFIQGVGEFDENKSYPLGIKNAAFGNIKIGLEATENLSEDVSILIFDKETGLTHNLREGIFEVELTQIGEFNDRFRIQFTDQTLSLDDFAFTSDKLKIFHTPEDHVLHVQNTRQDLSIHNIKLFDLLGRSIISTDTEARNQSSIEIKLPAMSAGVYLVKLTGEGGSAITRKLVIE
jgi:hypothetical protein